MTNSNPLVRVGLIFILVITAGAFFTLSACPPLDLFSQIISNGGADYEETANYAEYHTPQLIVYTGTFTPGDSYWRVTENQVEIQINPENGIVSGTGRQVHIKDSAYADDPAETITYMFAFEGTYEPDTQGITGVVNVTGDKTCTAYCNGVENYSVDIYANWTASLSENSMTIWGHVDQMGGYGDFTANK